VYACESSRTIGSWSISAGKRAFDAIIAGTALMFVLPFMTVIGILVKVTSTGPVLFRQQRVGQRGRVFTLLKFRSMAVNSDRSSKLTCSGDRRVTPVGKFLRRTKLDELPQLYNVVRGDMSLVGPRPDMPEYIATLSPSLSEVLLLRPGITSVASIEFSAEEAVLVRVPPDQLQSFYTETLLPRKIALDLEYARSSTLVKDLKLIARTIGVMF
jgi:lipopolysaccharide/colanic/teichoic acid biosynthesis glycosyltransferase